MLDLEEDMTAVLYGPDFANTFTRQRPSVADVDVVAIFGVVDTEALDGRAMAATRKVQMPVTQDVRADAEAERLAAEQAEATRKAQEEADAAEKAEADRLAAEQAEAARKAAEQAGNSGAQG